jgi:hypothetical protein
VRLFEHPDFEQAVIRAAEHFRAQELREAIIEKDYYFVTAHIPHGKLGGLQVGHTNCESR